MSTPLPLGARTLMFQARTRWAEAALEVDPTERYRLAHLAALRGAAAILATRPVAAKRGRPTSAWQLIEIAAPELVSWSAFFADSAVRRSAIEAGSRTLVRSEDADELVAVVSGFLAVAAEFIAAVPNSGSPQVQRKATRAAPGARVARPVLSIAS